MTNELKTALPDRVCIWDADKSDPTSTRGWTISFQENHPDIYVRASTVTRASPDVPELVTVGWATKYGNRFGTACFHRKELSDFKLAWSGDLTELVTRDQAAEIIAALETQALKDRKRADEAQSNSVLWQYSCDVKDQPPLIVKLWERLKDAEAKLAQYEAQEPVGWLHLHPDFTPEFSNLRLTDGDFDRGFREEPLYASPAPAADLKAENERLREALTVASMSAGFQYMTFETRALINAALNQ